MKQKIIPNTHLNLKKNLEVIIDSISRIKGTFLCYYPRCFLLDMVRPKGTSN
jgi:hypothetical protein